MNVIGIYSGAVHIHATAAHGMVWWPPSHPERHKLNATRMVSKTWPSPSSLSCSLQFHSCVTHSTNFTGQCRNVISRRFLPFRPSDEKENSWKIHVTSQSHLRSVWAGSFFVNPMNDTLADQKSRGKRKPNVVVANFILPRLFHSKNRKKLVSYCCLPTEEVATYIQNSCIVRNIGR